MNNEDDVAVLSELAGLVAVGADTWADIGSHRAASAALEALDELCDTAQRVRDRLVRELSEDACGSAP